MKTNTIQESQFVRCLIEASLEPLITINTEGKITDCNVAMVKIVGIDREDLLGTEIFSYFTEPQKVKELFQEAIAKGFVANLPLKMRHLKGILIDVLFSGSVYRDEKGNVSGVVIVVRDIAEQKWTTELSIANKALALQNDEKERRAEELVIANKELAFQNDEKGKRAEELVIANKELHFQNNEKIQRAKELVIANKELALQNDEKERRAEELVIANKELAFQNDEKGKRAEELVIANKELHFQNNEKIQRAKELVIANKELALQNDEKERRAEELVIANKELAFQNDEKEKRAGELVIANKELHFQNNEKISRAKELLIANKELAFQNDEKKKRADELIIADKEIIFQNKEKEKREIANRELEASSYSLKLASQYSLSLIEASLDPLVTISAEGKITDMNKAFVDITGLTREELTGTDFLNYFTEPQKAGDVYKEIFKNKFVTDFPLIIKNKDGKLTDVLFNGSVYKDDKGKVIGVVVVARDITDRKRIEKELSEAIVFAELATVFAEDAKIKAENATQIAVDAMKAKQQFLSNMSHEIRTPLNSIIGFTKVLLKTDFSAKQKEYLTAIKLSGDTLILLINDILDLAKIDAGKMTFEQVPFKMSLSIAAMLYLFETPIREKNLILMNEYDENIPEVLVGDPVRLHQIILNLISNAVKFTNIGKITTSVRLLSEDENYARIEFSVTDTGIGIEENKIAKVFDNFQQAAGDTSRLYGGTGLGLAIVKQLVEAQDGTISVKSKVNEGSTFSFNLNFLKTKAEVELELAPHELNQELQNINVLVVEDIVLNQLLMRTLLDDFGFTYEIAENGHKAIEKLKSSHFDIILMDLLMPEMNGFEATEYIRQTMKSNIPIIALTADVTTIDSEKCISVGMNGHISKPVDEKVLFNKIMELVNKSSIIKEEINEPDAEDIKVKCTDLGFLIQRTKSNPVLLQEMISLYLVQTPALISAMKKGLLNNDWESLYGAVHKMIPSFSIMGIHTEFETIARKVQDYASYQLHLDTSLSSRHGIPELIYQLETVCEQACEELEEELKLLKGD